MNEKFELDLFKRFILKIPRFLFVLFFISFFAKGQQPVLKNFSTKNGLPSNEVYYLHADKKGYIWICTDAGLVKYNGNTFKTFSSANGMPDNTIFEAKEDRHGRIWYRSFSGKVGYIFNDTVFTIAANKKIVEFIKDGIVSSFALDENDNLFIGKRNSEKISFYKITPPYGEGNITEIWKDSGSTKSLDIVAIGKNDFVFSDTRGYSYLYNINVFDQNHKQVSSEIVTLSDFFLFTSVYRTNNVFYVLANKILKKIDISTKTSESRSFRKHLVSAISVDPGIVMLGGRQVGMLCFKDGIYSEPFDHLLKDLTVTYVVKDYQGGYWFSTLESGVFYTPAQRINYFTPNPNTEEYINNVAALNDSVLILGYRSGKILSFNVQEKDSLKINTIYEDKNRMLGNTYNIYILNNKTIIASGSNGSIKYQTDSGKFNQIFYENKISIPIKQIQPYKDSILGLRLKEICVFNKNNLEFVKSRYESKDRLTSIAWDSVNNKLYVGGLRGLYDFYFQKNITEKDKILNCRVVELKSISGILYVATNADGLIIKNGLRYDTINEKMGLISNICKNITVDGDVIWVSTNKGISKVTYKNSGKVEIHNYPLNTFMDAISVSSIQIMKNKVWFFSGHHLYSFDTKINVSNSRFYITSILVNNSNIPLKSLIELDHRHSNITVKYDALFYDCDTKITYRYKVNKENNLWNYTNETNINFSNMAPGDYEFIVEAKNLKGGWIRADKTIQFMIDKPFWQKLWFILLLAAGLVIMIVFILRLRYLDLLKKELAKNELIISMYELETKAVKAQMNPHFIFNSLNSIMHFVLSKDTDNAYRYLVKFSKLVRKLLESNTSQSIKLEEEIDILNRYIEIEALRFEEAFSYELHVDEKLNLKTIEIPHMLIQPFVENAIWHGLLHKKGDKKVSINFIYLDEKRLNCIIEDNGVGREAKKLNDDAENTKTSLAIDFIKQHLLLISKTKNISCGFEITDKPNASGTIITITIPILN